VIREIAISWTQIYADWEDSKHTVASYVLRVAG
jgi:hypothetical protein